MARIGLSIGPPHSPRSGRRASGSRAAGKRCASRHQTCADVPSLQKLNRAGEEILLLHEGDLLEIKGVDVLAFEEAITCSELPCCEM